MTDAQVYFIFRFLLSLVHAIVWIWVLRLSVPLARRANTTDLRIFVLSIVFVLATVSVILSLSAAWAVWAPLPTDAIRATFGIAISAMLSLAGSVIIWKWPWRKSR